MLTLNRKPTTWGVVGELLFFCLCFASVSTTFSFPADEEEHTFEIVRVNAAAKRGPVGRGDQRRSYRVGLHVEVNGVISSGKIAELGKATGRQQQLPTKQASR